MDVTSNIIIIGAGLIGLCTADALLSRGAAVTVLEARPGPCEGTSFSNSGMIHPSQARSWEPAQISQPPNQIARTKAAKMNAAKVTADLGAQSRARLLAHMRRLNLPVRPASCVQIFPDMEAARAAQTGFDDIGVRANILIDPIDTFGQVACHFPNDSSGDARAFGSALAVDLETRGAEFIYGADDVEIRRANTGFKIRTGSRILAADHLVVAAGIHSVELLAQLELRLQLKPVAGSAADFALPQERDDLPQFPVMDVMSLSALTVFEDRIRIAGGWNVTDPQSFLDRWADLAPGLMLRLGEPIRIWTGVRPVSLAGRPYISGTSIPKLWVNTGHGHMGWTLCAGSGELLAKMIIENHQDRRFAFSG